MRILGIEFGTWSLKAVEMESRFRRVDILDFHEVRLPLEVMDPTETYRRAVTQLLARLPSHPEKIVTSLPPAQTALRFLPIPLKQRKKVEKTFRFELEDTVPFKLDAAIVEHHVMATKEGSVVFAAIAPNRHIQSHVEWLNSVGIDPDWLTFEGMGLINLYLSHYAQTNKEERDPAPTLLLDIGHHKTNLSIFQDDRIEHFRSFSWGGAAVTQALSVSLGVSLEEAERYKMNDLKMDLSKEEASKEAQEMLMAASQAFLPFLSDINHSLVAYRSLYQKRIERALITGGTSKIWGLEGFLGERLGVSVGGFHCFESVSLRSELESADERRFGEPLGRAIVFSRKAPLLFNFRSQSVAKGTSLAEVSSFLSNPNVVRVLQFCLVLIVALFIHVNIASYLAGQELDLAQKEVSKEFGDTFRTAPPQLKKSLTTDPAALKKYIDQKSSELEQKLKVLKKERTPMMSLIRAISGAFPKDVRVDVNTLALDDRNFVLEGVLYEGSLDSVTQALKGMTVLDKVTLSQEGQRFTYKGEVLGR